MWIFKHSDIWIPGSQLSVIFSPLLLNIRGPRKGHMPTSKITINPGSLDPYGHLSWLVESLSRDSVLGRNWTILMPAHKILKNCPPFFIFKNSERVLRIDIGRWKFQKFIITYLSLPRKNLKTQLQLLLPLNFAYAKKLLVKRAIFVLLFEGTNFIQKLIFISKNWPRLMKISESHKDISEMVWKKFGWWHLIPSWLEFCVLLFFTLVFGCFVILDLGLGKWLDVQACTHGQLCILRRICL